MGCDLAGADLVDTGALRKRPACLDCTESAALLADREIGVCAHHGCRRRDVADSDYAREQGTQERTEHGGFRTTPRYAIPVDATHKRPFGHEIRPSGTPGWIDFGGALRQLDLDIIFVKTTSGRPGPSRAHEQEEGLLMADNTDAKEQASPKPSPTLKRLDRLVGTWKMRGHAIGSEEENIVGTTTFKWLQGESGTSFFLQQDMEMDYAGTPIKSHELIGYNPKTKAFSSHVYSNMAPDPWPYEWDIQGDTLTISIKYGPMSATYTGKFSPDGNSFTGGWRPDPGADETINAPYDIRASRI
jgi:hypothetical protein